MASWIIFLILGFVYGAGFLLTARRRYHIMRPEWVKGNHVTTDYDCDGYSRSAVTTSGKWHRRYGCMDSPPEAYGYAMLQAAIWPLTWIGIHTARAVTMGPPLTPREAEQLERDRKAEAERLRQGKLNAVHELERENNMPPVGGHETGSTYGWE